MMQLLLAGSKPAQECRAKPWKNSAKPRKTFIAAGQKEGSSFDQLWWVLWNE